MRQKDRFNENEKLWLEVTKSVKRISSNKNKSSINFMDQLNVNDTQIKKTLKIINEQEFNENAGPVSKKSKLVKSLPINLQKDKHAGIDSSTAQKIIKGKIKIQAKLDLHGLNRKEAYQSLNLFIEKSFNKGFRNVQVITGKGKNGKGFLKENVPIWIKNSSISNYIIAISESISSDGGTGSLYIRIKNKNKK